MASNAAPDSGEHLSFAASTTDHRVFGKTLGTSLLKRPVAILDIVLVEYQLRDCCYRINMPLIFAAGCEPREPCANFTCLLICTLRFSVFSMSEEKMPCPIARTGDHKASESQDGIPGDQ